MKKFLFALLTALLVLFAATAVGLAVIHISGQPYITDVDKLELVESSGLSREEIMENYNAVMRFLSPFINEPFDLPTLKYSQSGAGHFADCKPIFNGVYLLGAISALCLILLARRKKLSPSLLRISGAVTLLIPSVFGVAVITFFDTLFVKFHQLFFNNSDWLFDPDTDEIINILPEEFFMHCALFIAAFWVLSAIAQLARGFLHKDK